MSEMAKTVSLITASVVAMLAAFLDFSADQTYDVQKRVGTLLNQFEDTPPKRMRIVKFDQETVDKREFKVAEEEGLWQIPSKQGYPADAAERMAEAATCLIDLEIQRVAAESASEHANLGVIDPSSSGLNSKSEGVGTRVIMSDETGKTLTDMVIGKQVKDSDSLYYIRNTNQDAVFVVTLNPDKLSTRFEDWIEDDLLQINPMDIRRVHIKDYTVELRPVLSPGGRIEMQVGWDRRGEMTLLYDDNESAWAAELLQAYDRKKNELVSYTLAEDEQLSDDALSGLRTALDELLIVDVERKPEGLSADLKAGSDFLKNNKTATALAMKGFAPVPIGPDSQKDILSSEGEIVCTMQDGVEYVLRFGNLQLIADQQAENPESPTEQPGEQPEDAKAKNGIHRYLFVMAQFNSEILTKPELAELPPLPEEEKPAEEETLAEETAGDDTEQAAEDAAAEESPEEPKETEEPKEEEPKEIDATEEPEDEKTESEETKDDGPSELEKITAEREAIKLANQRLEDEYQEKLDAGQQRVKDLNERFGDWYYVIDNKVYDQIHLGRNKVIIKKEKPAEGEAADANPAGSGIPGLPNLQIGQ